MTKLKTVVAVSAGGIVFRACGQPPDVSHPEMVLCGRLAHGIWGLPKGTPHQGESLEQTALREVREETGLDVRILEPIGSIEYWFVVRRLRIHKTVHYYLMESTGGDLSRHDPEYDVARWIAVDQATSLMSYENEAEMVQRAAGLIDRRLRISAAPDHASASGSG